MNLGSDPADQIVRYSLAGTEVALKLSGLAAKNFALFVYAVLKDQKKTRGKTRLVRMLKEQRPFKFFQIPQEALREFAKEARAHGLLYVPIRNKREDGPNFPPGRESPGEPRRKRVCPGLPRPAENPRQALGRLGPRCGRSCGRSAGICKRNRRQRPLSPTGPRRNKKAGESFPFVFL